MKKVIGIIILIILVPVLFVNGTILIDSYVHKDKIPSFFGWKPFIVLSGSMESEIYSGDIVVVKETDIRQLKQGDVIAFRTGEIVITHRITNILIEGEEIKFITKGDNNNTEDSGYVLPEQIEGVYQFKINKIGNLAIFVQTPIGMIVCLSIPFLLLVLIELIESKKNRKDDKLEKEIENLKKENEELRNKM